MRVRGEKKDQSSLLGMAASSLSVFAPDRRALELFTAFA